MMDEEEELGFTSSSSSLSNSNSTPSRCRLGFTELACVGVGLVAIQAGLIGFDVWLYAGAPGMAFAIGFNVTAMCVSVMDLVLCIFANCINNYDLRDRTLMIVRHTTILASGLTCVSPFLLGANLNNPVAYILGAAMVVFTLTLFFFICC
jgi:hypothetical protein